MGGGSCSMIPTKEEGSSEIGRMRKEAITNDRSGDHVALLVSKSLADKCEQLALKKCWVCLGRISLKCIVSSEVLSPISVPTNLSPKDFYPACNLRLLDITMVKLSDQLQKGGRPLSWGPPS